MSRQKNKAEETTIEHLDLLVGRISESFDAVFSRYFNFQFLYRHPGSTDMFFTMKPVTENVSHVGTCTVDLF